jgi:parallel beta-helix repeat protein
MLILLVISMLTLAFNIQPVKSSPTTITVPDDYVTIQEAINNANEEDTIYVRTGTYYEHLYIYKNSLTLIGENRDNTIIDSNWTGTVIYITANDIMITGFTIQRGGGLWPYSGIFLDYSSNSCLYNNEAINNDHYGIYLRDSTNISVYANDALDNYVGIVLYSSTDISVFNNNVTNNTMGIFLQESSNISVFNNKVDRNNGDGIVLIPASDVSLHNNNITNNGYGISLYYSSSYNSIFHNNFINNAQQVYSSDCVNVWDDGYPSGGNYWSDYVSVDVKNGIGQDLPGSDGIGDTPYVIDADNVDRYPLMNPYGAPSPSTYALTITATVGGTTDPPPATYTCSANSTVQVTAIPEANYLFDYWELDDINVGSANPYSVYMEKDHTLKPVFLPFPFQPHPPPLSASISPLSASILIGQSVTFTSTVYGGYTPYSYQWYLNGNPVSGANATSLEFTPTTSGIYYVHLKVTDAKGNPAQSETARITVATVPVGGYSFPIQVSTKAEPVLPYIALITALTVIFTKLRPKTKRKAREVSLALSRDTTRYAEA